MLSFDRLSAPPVVLDARLRVRPRCPMRVSEGCRSTAFGAERPFAWSSRHSRLGGWRCGPAATSYWGLGRHSRVIDCSGRHFANWGFLRGVRISPKSSRSARSGPLATEDHPLRRLALGTSPLLITRARDDLLKRDGPGRPPGETLGGAMPRCTPNAARAVASPTPASATNLEGEM